jgi:hypothetical protein
VAADNGDFGDAVHKIVRVDLDGGDDDDNRWRVVEL